MSDVVPEDAQGDARSAPLLRVRDLHKVFRVPIPGGLGRRRELLRAVDGVSFDVAPGETFGLVGESGCGKSTVARCLVRLVDATSGEIIFKDTDVRALKGGDLRRFRRDMQIVFQDPFASLDPRMSALSIVEEPLVVHGIGSRAERLERANEMLALVGIMPEQVRRKPHEFSGGQQQRIGLARALMLDPDMVVLDEPISALDVSIQAQVLNFLREVQERLALTYVFIVHDLAVAEYFCDRIAVLYLGAIVETGDSETLFREPLHPYTVSLLSAVPIPDPASERRRNRIVLTGEVSPVGAQTVGCRFASRCPIGKDRQVCREQEPVLTPASSGHQVACHFPGELSANGGTNDASEPPP